VRSEGKTRKLVRAVEQVTYSVSAGVAYRGQKAKLITERAVFEVEPDGLVLTEVAKGVDVREDVLQQMEFRPTRIADPLPLMEEALFGS
jgi:propionate CoA-transferase